MDGSIVLLPVVVGFLVEVGTLEDIEGTVDDIKVGEAVEVDGVAVGASHSTSAPWARETSWKQYSALSSCLM